MRMGSSLPIYIPQYGAASLRWLTLVIYSLFCFVSQSRSTLITPVRSRPTSEDHEAHKIYE